MISELVLSEECKHLIKNLIRNNPCLAYQLFHSLGI